MRMIYDWNVGYVVTQEVADQLLTKGFTVYPDSLPIINVLTPSEDDVVLLLQRKEIKEPVKEPVKKTVKKKVTKKV